MILFRRCYYCRRLLLVGMFTRINPKAPPVVCGDCARQQAKEGAEAS